MVLTGPITFNASAIEEAETKGLEGIQVLIREELKLLAIDVQEMQKFRDYYNGEQNLVYGSEEFREQFSDSFKDFRDNWCGVVVDATLDKMKMIGLDLGTNQQAQEIWNTLSLNDIDEQQIMLYESMLVDKRSSIIVWPSDDKGGARVDWNPGSLVRVRYSDEDHQEAIYAVKRWQTAGGQIRVNFYTASHVWKFTQQAMNVPTNAQGVMATVPSAGNESGLEPYKPTDEEWPLPHDFGEVPVVEFVNKRGSELEDIIPLQDAINYLLVASFVGGEATAWPQKVFFTGVTEPRGGWKNGPGKVWHVPPDLDADGQMHFGSAYEFKGSESDGFRSLIDMVLQHMAHTSKTPVRLFFKSDRGGRGDAPSGDSLLVDDEPHLEKVEDRETRAGNSWYKVFRLIAKAKDMGELPPGEVIWQDLRTKYRSSLLDEAQKMKELGVPFRFILKKIGLDPDEITEVETMLQSQGMLETGVVAIQETNGSGTDSRNSGGNSGGNSGE